MVSVARVEIISFFSFNLLPRVLRLFLLETFLHFLHLLLLVVLLLLLQHLLLPLPSHLLHHLHL